MPWRHPSPRAQQVAHKGLAGEGTRRLRDPLPTRLLPPELRSAPGTRRSGVSRTSRGGAEWWQASSGESLLTDLGEDAQGSQLRLPPLPTVAPRTTRNRTGLKSLQLPPMPLAGASRTPASLHPRPGECQASWRGSARKTPDSLGALLGDFLPRRFREFLRQLGAEWVERPQPPTSSKSYHQKSISGPRRGRSPQFPSCSFLPDLRGQSWNLQNSPKKNLLDQIPTLGPKRRDCNQFTKVKKVNKSCGLQASKLKVGLTHSSSGEGSGPGRRRCPFRVRFADETLWDTALRYWERNCALQQDITENGSATQSETSASESVFGSVWRWLESLPMALDCKAREEALYSSPFNWDSPSWSIPDLQDHLSEDTSMNSRLPYIPRATTHRQQRDPKTLLAAQSIPNQVGKLACSWSQKLESFLPCLELPRILNLGHPKGYQRLLPSDIWQQDQP